LDRFCKQKASLDHDCLLFRGKVSIFFGLVFTASSLYARLLQITLASEERSGFQALHHGSNPDEAALTIVEHFSQN
jgi:hypothetical protein